MWSKDVNQWTKNFILMTLMLCAAGLAAVLEPKHFVANPAESGTYERIIPREFGEWIAEKDIGRLIVNPQQEEQLESLYSETVSRTYINRQTGKRIMLSIAYGADQTHENQVHKPEVCYPSQGFQLLGKQKDQIQTAYRDIPVLRVQTRLGERVEPVTYWIRFGDKLIRGAVEQNLARIQYGLSGDIPDGLLFRVSSIESDAVVAYRLHDQFVVDLLQALKPNERSLLVGRSSQGVESSANSLTEVKAPKD